MNDDIRRLRNLVDTYRLSRPVSPELQRYAIDSRMGDLRHILKKSGRYGLATWFVIMIFALFRKYGLHITMLQSKIIAGVTAAAVASGSAAVAYRGAQYIIEAAGRPAQRAEETIETPAPGMEKQIEKTTPGRTMERQRVDENKPVPAIKEKAAPAEKKLPDADKQGKGKKKKSGEHNAIGDIPTL